MQVAERSRSQSTTSTLSSLINITQTPPLDTHAAQFQGDIDPALSSSSRGQPVQQKVRPPSSQDFLRPSSSFSNGPHHHQTDLQGDQPSSFSYPGDSSLTYNIHFNPPLFSVSSSIYPMAPQSASPFAVGAYNAGVTATLSPSAQHTRPAPVDTARIDARRGPPTPLPFTNPYSAGYYISTGLTPLYTATQFRAVGGDPFFGAVSHLTPTPSASSFEAAQQDYNSFPVHRPQPLRGNEPSSMNDSRQLAPVVESAESPVKSETDAVASKAMSPPSKDASQIPRADAQQNTEVSSAASSQESQQASRFQQTQMPVHGNNYSMAAPESQRADLARPVGNPAGGPMPFEYSAPQPLPNFSESLESCKASVADHPPLVTSGQSVSMNGHHNRLPSVAFPGSAPVFNHPPQTYSVFFGPDGQPHYIANAMPQAIADINGNLTYAYPPQAFQPAQAMSHHAWARQQNAFAYHCGDDMEMDAPTPEHRHSIASPNGNVSRSPATRYSARAEDADGEDDEDAHYDMMPRATMKRSRSVSFTSVSENSARSDVEWQPRRKSAKKSSTSSRKTVDSKRLDGRKALMQMHAEEASDGNSSRVRYTSNAEDKQTDWVSVDCFPVIGRY